MANQITLAEGARIFLSGLSEEERQGHSQEVNRFIRWYGTTKLFSDVAAHDVELYAEELESSTSDPSQRAEALRAFLSYARQQGWAKESLATQVRIRRPSGRKATRAEQRQAKVVQLTPEGYRKIKGELEALIKERPNIAEELRRARADKDFRENAPLDAARQHQAHVEGRIRELEATIKSAAIIDEDHISDIKIGLGSKVVIRDLSYDEEIAYTLVSPSEVNLKLGKISVASPTGKALLDKEVGDEVEVRAPVGVLRYRVERVEK